MQGRIEKLLAALFILPIIFLTASTVKATHINDVNNGEAHLYSIVNNILGSPNLYSNSNDIPQVSDSADNYWIKTSSSGKVMVTVRYAGYDQELGLIGRYDNQYFTIVPRYDINNGQYLQKDYSISYSGEFAFVEKLNNNPNTEWFSDDRNDTFDHFIAFDVTDHFKSVANQAWIIAWEDIAVGSGGDGDYNDLVALVIDVKPTFAEEVILDTEPGAGKIVVSWTAISEKDVLGYNIFRAAGINGQFKQINDNIIMAKGGIEITVDYDFVDDGVSNGRFYQYKLEEVSTAGISIYHGPVIAVPSLLYMFK
jgi:hypothetical protein